MNLQVDHLILGAGVTGLAAGAMLKPSTVILEKEDRPGGLVRSKCFNGGIGLTMYFIFCISVIKT